MLTYPGFVRGCYAFFVVAVLAAVLKLSVSGAEPSFLEMLPSAPAASVAAELAPRSPESPEDPRLGSFSDDDEAERLEAVLARGDERSSSREGFLLRSDREVAASSDDAPVFRRPSLARDSSPGPVCGDLGDAPGSSRVVFPLPDEYFDSYDDTWGAARPQGGHEGSDLMSPSGTPEFALTDGRLVAVAGSNENGWNRLGGYTVMLEAAYDIGPIKKGDLFYYAHMDRESYLPIGTEVRAGQKIGTVGDTGEGPEGTRGKFPPHLHLGWYDAELSEERSEAESGAMDPYPLLVWLERNGGAVSGGTDASYCQAPQSPKPAPSTGEPDWPAPSAPSERPDLDTGREDASPAARRDKHDHPKRDRDGVQNDNSGRENDDGGKGDKGANGEEEAGDGAEATKEPQNEAKGPSLRKKLKVRLNALLRDLPSGTFDRSPPQDQSDEQQEDEGHEDGAQNGENPEPDRPDEDRPETEPDIPSEETPKPAAPVAVPDRQPRPVAGKPAENPEPGEEEPEAATPLNADRKVSPKPKRMREIEETVTAEDIMSPREGDAHAQSETRGINRRGDLPNVEAGEGE